MRLDLSDARIQRTPAGSYYLFESRYGFAYLLNETSTFLLEEMSTTDHTEASLVSVLMEHFDVSDHQDVEGDVRQFVTVLRSYGLLL